MNQITKWFLLIVCSVVAAFLAGTFASNYIRSGDKAATPPILLTVSADELEIGKLPESSEHHHPFHIRNSSTDAVVIRRFESSCNCLSVTPGQDVTLLPGESVRFDLAIRATPELKETLPDGGIRRELLLTPVFATTTEKEQRVDFEFAYHLTPTIRLEPARIAFGQRSIRADGLILRATIQLAPDVKSVEVAPHPEWDVRLIPNGPQTSSTQLVMLIARNPKVCRPVIDVISFTPVTHDGSKWPNKSLQVDGEISPDVVATPRTLHYGRAAVGETMTDTVRLHSLTGTPFKVLGVRQLPDGWHAIPSEYDEHVWSITARASGAGEQSHELQFRIRNSEGGEELFSFPVVYLGYQPTPRGAK